MAAPHTRNNFTPLRLVAAFLVLLGHSFPLYGMAGQDPLAKLGYPHLHGLGVNIFFIISGYLIAASWQRQQSLKRYVQHRALRIFPALGVVILVSALALGPVFTSLPTGAYFAHGETWRYLGGMLVVAMPFHLPGVFETHPYPAVVNGSLWSLEPELFCYVAVAMLGVLGLFRKPVLLLAPVMLMAFYVVIVRIHPSLAGYLAGGDRLYAQAYVYNLCLFWLGAAYYMLREQIMFRFSFFLLAAAVGLAVYSLYAPYGRMVYTVLLPYMVLYLALCTPPVFNRFFQENDFSYGMFLWAFPVQQAYLALVGEAMGFAGFVLCSATVSVLLGACSWRFVERPALKRKA